ncbi:RNA polymerase sigma factor SigB [Bacillus solimangrovi]|uniref:RNA polymerase sigma factor SigB n=1 Tax=Bacillus solimangrovi TaxID=1305675 RepID=A0A1E5LG77_9BACI|nr:RNA polymerase sigma factor SigB [Bacillus solimangrovi]OEH93074.1 RNA polymerase sigma factor SigB [Bacillus solimangrovi]
MATQSQPRKPNKQQVYKWIEDFQNERNKEESQAKIVEQYSELVEVLARKYSHRKNIHDDLVQVGMLGLLAAIRRYDSQFGKTFESFAVPTIIGEIKRYIRDKTWSVHVPRRIKELSPKLKKAVEELTTKLQRSPNVQEIALYIGVSEEEILETMEMGKSYQALSVDSKIESDSDGSTVTLLDLVGNRDVGYEIADQRLLLEKAFHVLTERERLIIKYTFFDNMNQKEAGECLGISQMHVSRLQRRALKKLREAIRLEHQECIDP